MTQLANNIGSFKKCRKYPIETMEPALSNSELKKMKSKLIPVERINVFRQTIET